MPPHLIFGAGGIGTTEKSFTFTWHTPEKTAELLSVLKRLEVLELDSAASYPPKNPWCTEALLGQAKAADAGFIINSKIAGHVQGPKLNDEAINASVEKTLQLLGVEKVSVLFSHFPDVLTPLDETAAAFHRQHQLGRFERLGLCNYSVEDMAKYFEICEEKGYVKPTVYQGSYNALSREAEAGLIPLLRKHNCVFQAYSPLAGGFLTGKVTEALDSGDSASLNRTRWQGDSVFPVYVSKYTSPAMHDAIRRLKAVCESASPRISVKEAAERWIMHHSALQDGDGVIFGSKTIENVESNVDDFRKGPLDGDALKAVESMWETVQDGMKDPSA
ncbi:uncharacterized protein E0L32_000951 [Thyridium curvatum]|uniref:NADP-dependent oxidoreductase domain-containing protein n=1 Tax=Thyridium curvatum TaxID=1093900 RepID=A0A507B240_9PEZI|nr:uncharacterized protein E0L32_000951 [Thyridium curvatum]TPX12774.1 hypothetical protein E0L32_000951 [Thyridium curvatum]